MAFRKYQSVEKAEVLPPKEQHKISSNLHKLGKTSAQDLSDEEREAALDAKRV
jgi:glutathione synthase/RimK-type ligase-like ATP-grasp enzyme